MSVPKRQVQPSPNSFRTGPDERGHFGIYGGRFVAETLMPLILDLEKAYAEAKIDPAFQQEMDGYLRDYVGRPSPLYFAERLTQHCGGAKIYFKREELNHTGAHKVNNVLGQIMVARRMGKKRIIAETGAGMHGVATATLCARFGLDCVVYMGAVDVERQKPNVFRMQMLGAEVRPVVSGSKTLKDAMNEALRDWVTNVQSTFYCIGTVAGPHPYPMMVREFQSVIGRETREQMLRAEGRLPDSLVACIGGGSNAMGLFHPFLDDTQIEIYGVEAAGHGLSSGLHAASIAGGKPGVLHGNRTYLLMDDDGQIKEAHSISAGLDYPGIGPEHAWLNDVGRVTFLSATDDEALAAFQLCSRLEGIIPALEPAHALARVLELAPKKSTDHLTGTENVVLYFSRLVRLWAGKEPNALIEEMQTPNLQSDLKKLVGEYLNALLYSENRRLFPGFNQPTGRFGQSIMSKPMKPAEWVSAKDYDEKLASALEQYKPLKT